jgi:hypothetical protein
LGFLYLHIKIVKTTDVCHELKEMVPRSLHKTEKAIDISVKI